MYFHYFRTFSYKTGNIENACNTILQLLIQFASNHVFPTFDCMILIFGTFSYILLAHQSLLTSNQFAIFVALKVYVGLMQFMFALRHTMTLTHNFFDEVPCKTNEIAKRWK